MRELVKVDKKTSHKSARKMGKITRRISTKLSIMSSKVRFLAFLLFARCWLFACLDCTVLYFTKCVHDFIEIVSGFRKFNLTKTS